MLLDRETPSCVTTGWFRRASLDHRRRERSNVVGTHQLERIRWPAEGEVQQCFVTLAFDQFVLGTRSPESALPIPRVPRTLSVCSSTNARHTGIDPRRVPPDRDHVLEADLRSVGTERSPQLIDLPSIDRDEDGLLRVDLHPG